MTSLRLAIAAVLLSWVAAPAAACSIPPPLVYFAHGSAAITPRAATTLDMFIADYRRQAEHIEAYTLIGHTDASGSDAVNRRLSRRRAEAVRDYMVAKGVPARIITVTGMGSSELAARDEPVGGDNRRVHIFWRWTATAIAASQAEAERRRVAGEPRPCW